MFSQLITFPFFFTNSHPFSSSPRFAGRPFCNWTSVLARWHRLAVVRCSCVCVTRVPPPIRQQQQPRSPCLLHTPSTYHIPHIHRGGAEPDANGVPGLNPCIGDVSINGSVVNYQQYLVRVLYHFFLSLSLTIYSLENNYRMIKKYRFRRTP